MFAVDEVVYAGEALGIIVAGCYLFDTNTHTHAHTNTHTHIHTNIHAYTHKHTCTHTRTHTHGAILCVVKHEGVYM